MPLGDDPARDVDFLIMLNTHRVLKLDTIGARPSAPAWHALCSLDVASKLEPDLAPDVPHRKTHAPLRSLLASIALAAASLLAAPVLAA
ncbi:MAG: hypothetical protein ACI9U2_004852, partial [Bradymonadia bacterium]